MYHIRKGLKGLFNKFDGIFHGGGGGGKGIPPKLIFLFKKKTGGNICPFPLIKDVDLKLKIFAPRDFIWCWRQKM